MGRYVFRRFLQMIPTVFGVLVITFILFNVVGGSPASMMLGVHVSPEALEEFDEARGFNKPLLFGNWASTRAYSESDFGQNAGPWTQVPGVQYESGERGRFIRLPGGSDYPVPLAFEPRGGNTYRFIFRYRLEGGAAELVYDAGNGATGRVPLAVSKGWKKVRLPFDVSTNAPARPRLEVTDGEMAISSVQFQRRVTNPFDSQFIFYLKQVARLDLGESHSSNQRVSHLLKTGIIPSLTLTVPIFFGGLVLAVSLSLLCAFFRDTWIDRSFVLFSVALMSINYLVWIVAGQYFLAFRAGWFPVWGFESWAFLMLPVFIGIFSGLGTDLRFFRTIMLDEMYKEYIRTAFAKGLGRPAVLFKHVLKNAMIPIVTSTVIAIPFLYTGSLLLESFFGIPGLGYLGVNAINSSDVDVIRGIVLIGSITFVLANLLTDLCYALVDPRVRLR